MSFPAFSMFVEYVCEDCGIKELDIEIIPKKECPNCKQWFTVFEEVDDEE